MKSILKVIQQVSREENDTDKSVNEIKDDENNFHTNLSLILNEYKSKQVDFNTRKDKPLNEELENETDNINEKLEILTKDNNKKPVVYKTFTRSVLSEDEKIDEMVTQIFSNNIILKDEMNKIEEIRTKLSKEELDELNFFFDK